MQPHSHGTLLLGDFLSTHPEFSTLSKECLFLCLIFLHFPPLPPQFPSLLRPIGDLAPPICPPKVASLGLSHRAFPIFLQKAKKSQCPPQFTPFFLN